MDREKAKEKFIIKARKRHGDKYDYSKVDYVDSQTKVCIICPEHGEFFQAPSAHVRGNGCPVCANSKRGLNKKWGRDTFIYKSQLVHGSRYSYEHVVYVNNNTKVKITCPYHGVFEQTPLAHVFGKQGCPICAGRNNTTQSIIEQFRDLHGDRYDYSKVEFKRMWDKVIIGCPEHGDFLQTPEKHLLGQGCPKCGKSEGGKKQRMSKEEFIRKSHELYGNIYDYSKVDFVTTHVKVEIVCPKHGSFFQRPYDHLNGHGCPTCGSLSSRGEDEIYEYVCSIVGKENVVKRDRELLGDGRELDIYVPSKKIAFEYDGLRWHSEQYGKDRHYHLRKTELCHNKGVSLIHIFEDEYLNGKEIVLSKISRILGASHNLPRVMARKCVIKEINKPECLEFLKNNHIQGYTNSTVLLGAYHEEALVGVMCFTKTGTEGTWVLTRFACDIHKICNGVGGKLFSHFVRQYNPNVVKSFLDRRWCLSDENLYTMLGFKLDKVVAPDYRYIDSVNPTERIHKFNLRKKEIHRKYNFDMSMTESQMVKKLGLIRIWDCGLYRYVWTKTNAES